MATAPMNYQLLADRIIPAEGIGANIVRIAAANVLLIMCAWLAVPLSWTPVPITGQTFGVLLVAVLLGSRRGALTLALYLFEGFAGLPVFAPIGLPGAARLAGPTAGYLLAYPLAAFAVGWLVERGAGKSATHLANALFAGEMAIFAGGCAWLALWMHAGWHQALSAGLIPFIPGEIIKLALVVAAVRGAELARIRSQPQG
ncbi:MAG: biotin transporter BioY [Candidatus Acidiferrales bacterium]